MPGPSRIDTAALALRGSRLAKRRMAAPEPAKPKRIRPRPIGDLLEIIKLIPGYDPYRDAAGYYFDEKAAAKAIRFIETQRHVKGELAGRPLLLEDWQKAFVANLFGWKRPDGCRRYRKCFLFIPRKNGKTVCAAALLLYLLFEDGEPGAEIYGAASEFNQASLVFHHAAGMVRQNQDLLERSKTYQGQAKAIQLNKDYSTYRVISREAASSHGFNSHAYVVDEVHCLDNSELIDVLETSTGARRQPLGIYISTSDFERENSPCNVLHDYAVKVRDGIIDDPKFLPVIYEASREADWKSPAVWAAANPNLGVSLSLEYIEDACKKAQETPRFENEFKRLHLNIRTEQATRWMPIDLWDSCKGPGFNLERLRGRACYGGLDLASNRDLNALVLLFPDGDAIDVLPFFWVPEANIEVRERRDRVPYSVWVKQGHIIPMPGDCTHYGIIRAKIGGELQKMYGINDIGIDHLFQGAQLAQELEQDGLKMTGYAMSYVNMAAPVKEFERLLLTKNLRHDGNPVLRWMFSNVMMETDSNGNHKPSKKESYEKIDGIVALLMALGRVLVDKQSGGCPIVTW